LGLWTWAHGNNQTTRCDGKSSFSLFACFDQVLVQLLSMELQFLGFFSAVPGSMACDIKENSLSAFLLDDATK